MKFLPRVLGLVKACKCGFTGLVGPISTPRCLYVGPYSRTALGLRLFTPTLFLIKSSDLLVQGLAIISFFVTQLELLHTWRLQLIMLLPRIFLFKYVFSIVSSCLQLLAFAAHGNFLKHLTRSLVDKKTWVGNMDRILLYFLHNNFLVSKFWLLYNLAFFRISKKQFQLFFVTPYSAKNQPQTKCWDVMSPCTDLTCSQRSYNVPKGSALPGTCEPGLVF